ncbi:MAG TPA: histidine kinase [Pseudonocardiaceae bacterium]
MAEAEGGTAGARDVRRSLVGQSVLVALVCVVIDSLEFAMRGPGIHSPLEPVLLLLVVAVDAALALPARLSGWVALAHAVVGVVLLGGDYAGKLIAGYRAGAWLRGWSAPASLVALSVGIVLTNLSSGRANWLFCGLEVGSNAVLPWLVGRYTTARRAYIDELRHRREVELRDAAAEVDNAVAKERTSIARDLHDVISHHVSAIGVHAGAARIKLGTGRTGDGVTDSLAAVEAASRAAMVDLRTMLDLLHGASDTTNQPGLDNLEELLCNVRRSGLAARLSVLGVPRPVPGSLDIALYRITQEMLTNALRHGDGIQVDVEIRYEDTSISLAAGNGIGPLEVPAEEDGTGRGLAGIRTRAAMFHGTVSYGPDPDNHRWETMVTVPMGETS